MILLWPSEKIALPHSSLLVGTFRTRPIKLDSQFSLDRA